MLSFVIAFVLAAGKLAVIDGGTQTLPFIGF